MKEYGILDPEGKYKNPLTGKKYNEIYNVLANVKPAWSKLPLYKEARSVINLIEKNRVCVIESGTGTGKTVILPKLALHTLDYKGKVVMTIPKKAATLSSASFAAACLDVKLGEEVGFQYQGAIIEEEGEEEEIIYRDSKSTKTKLLFSTEGSVVQQLNRDPALKEYNIVIIDEAHERSIDIDRLLVLLREALLINPKLKVIVTSATLPEGLFENYFREVGLSVGEKKLPGVPNKPVELVYNEKDVSIKLRQEKALEIYIKEVLKKNKKGDTLMYITSQSQGKKLCTAIKSEDKNILCLLATSQTIEKDPRIQEIYSKETIEALRKADLIENFYERKIIMATKIYESSVTLEPLIYVIDNGINLESSYDPERMEDQLSEENISQSQAIQRKGRAGRVYPGICYRAYSQDQYNKMLRNPIVPIRKSNITEMILSLLLREDIANISQMLDFLRKFIERPPKVFVLSALRTLHLLGLVDYLTSEGTITEKGRIILEINSKKVNDISSSIALYYAKIYNCSTEMCMILAALKVGKDVDDLFIETKSDKDKEKLEERKKFFYIEEGDAFSLYEIVKGYARAKFRYNSEKAAFKKEVDPKIWCKRNYLDCNKLNKIYENAIEMYQKTPRLNIDNEYDIIELKDRISYCLLKGFLPNLAKKEKIDNKGKNKNKEKNKNKKSKDAKIYKNIFPAILSKASVSKKSFFKQGNYMIYKSLFNRNNQKSFNLVTRIDKDIIRLLNDFEKSYLSINF